MKQSLNSRLTPLVPVVIPTFNRATLVVKAIEGVFARTHKDYEVVVVDDGSIDNTRDILKPYRQRLRYFYQANRGARAAQNLGIDLLNGEWISILADDDEWLPHETGASVRGLRPARYGLSACFTNATSREVPTFNKPPSSWLGWECTHRSEFSTIPCARSLHAMPSSVSKACWFGGP